MPVVEELNSEYLFPATKQAHLRYSSLTYEPKGQVSREKGAGLGAQGWSFLPPSTLGSSHSWLWSAYLLVKQAEHDIQEKALQAVEQGKDVGKP